MFMKKKVIPVTLGCIAISLLLCGGKYYLEGNKANNYYGVGEVGNNKSSILSPFTTTSTSSDNIEDTRLERETPPIEVINQEVLFANYFGEVNLTQTESNYSIPEIYVSPNHMAILSTQTGDGLTALDEDNSTMEISFNLSNKQSLTLEIGVICDGEYYTLSNTKGIDFTENFNTTPSQEYYICITNRTSENAIISNGRVQ